MKIDKTDVIYPCRIPQDVFKRVRELAEKRDLSASQIIRLALREMIEQSEKPKIAEPTA